jgi:hypothetical protein
MLVRKTSFAPVTGSFTIFFSEGKRVPIWAKLETDNRIITRKQKVKRNEFSFFCFLFSDDIESLYPDMFDFF